MNILERQLCNNKLGIDFLCVKHLINIGHTIHFYRLYAVMYPFVISNVNHIVHALTPYHKHGFLRPCSRSPLEDILPTSSYNLPPPDS